MQIHDLTRQNPATGSQLVFDTGSATYKALVSDVAKVIMEQYNGTTLAGSAQTPKAAIDTLNGNLTPQDVRGSSQTLASVFANQPDVSVRFAIGQNNSDNPSAGTLTYVLSYRYSANYGTQFALETGILWQRAMPNGAWIKVQMDAVLSFIASYNTVAKDFDSFPNNAYVWVNNGSGTYSHAPGSIAGLAMTMQEIGASHKIQIFIQHSAQTVYLRSMADSTWGAWRKITTSAV